MTDLRRKIEQLINGKFEYEMPELILSEKEIRIRTAEGKNCQGILYLGTENNRNIKGYVSSDHPRILPGIEKFSDSAVQIPYGIDVKGLKSKEEIQGALTLLTDIGEFQIPVFVQIEEKKITSSEGEIQDLQGFAKLAQTDFMEAFRLFNRESFQKIIQKESPRIQAFYKGALQNPVTYQNLEEFLIGSGLKKEVTISLKEQEAVFYQCRETRQETVEIQKHGWGHLRLEIETQGDFLEVNKKVITEEDFIGSVYRLEYVIRRRRRGKGKHFGRIWIKSPYQKLGFLVVASAESQTPVDMKLFEKKKRAALVRVYLDYRTGKLQKEAWLSQSEEILRQLRQEGCGYPEYQMYQAFLEYQKKNVEKAGELIQGYQKRNFGRQDAELMGMYLYLAHLTGSYPDREKGVRRLRELYRKKEESCLLLNLILRMDASLSPSRAVFMMEEQFEKGCRSPLLYLEAYERLKKDKNLLHRLTPFWTQVLAFAGKEGQMDEEMCMRIGYLSGYAKEFRQSLYRVLEMAYEACPSEDLLNAICRYIMKGNPRKQKYFPWFEKAVEQGLRLTRLYEYYMETVDTSYQRELPKTLLLYFAFNSSTLGDTRKAYIYASVVNHKKKQPQIFESYRDVIGKFTERKLAEGAMNEDYAVLYQEFSREPQNLKEAEEIGKMLFTYRLYCDDPKIRSVIVRHHQLGKEEEYPCIRGIAYIRLYTKDAAVLFKDEQQRRYTSTVDYNVKKLMDENEILPRCLQAGCQNPGLLLSYCENHKIEENNLTVYQQMVRSKGFTGEYKRQIRKEILNYCLKAVKEDKELHLNQMEFRSFAAVDKKALLEIIVEKGMFARAFEILEEFGTEQVDPGVLLRICSYMIEARGQEYSEELLALTEQTYRLGKYNVTALNYLLRYYRGTMDEAFRIWKSAVGFQLDTYEFEERILCLLMFTENYREDGWQVLESYVENRGREKVIAGYLTFVSYGYFMKGKPFPDFVQQCLTSAVQREWKLDRICRFSLLQKLTEQKERSEAEERIIESILEECGKENLFFAFLQRLPASMLSPYQLDDKTFVEYRTDPGAKVTLCYALDTGLGNALEYTQEPLHRIYEGVFAKGFTLFYGETLHYYFVIEKDKEKMKLPEQRIAMNRVDMENDSKYQLLNQMLAACHLEKEEEVKKKMEQYLRQERYVKTMFTIEKEA